MRLSGTKASSVGSSRGLGNQLWDLGGSRPSLDLNFAGNKTLVDDISTRSPITFTRASSGTYVGSDGLIKTATTNLLLRSEEFDNASWAKSLCSVTADNSTAPSGTNSADFIVPTTTNGAHQLYTSVNTIANTAYTFSFYVKASGYSRFQFGPGNTGVGGLDKVAAINLSLSNPVVSQDAIFNNSVSAVSVGNGWYRVSGTFTTSAGGFTTIAPFQTILNNSGASSFAGDGTSGIFLWGAQLEQSSTVGEYIPTTSTINSAPRFDHNPTTGESLGLLVEEQRTNLGLYSDVSQSSYIENITVSANNATSPDGTNNATRLTSTTTGTSNSNISDRNVAVSSNTVYTFSCYLKQGNTPLSSINLWYGGGTYREVRIAYTWSSKTIALTGTAGTGFTGSATDAGNGWVRLVVSLDSGNNTSVYARIHVRDNTTSGVTGDFVYAWGRQIEAGSFPTSYIPTTTATVTRSADVASITGANFGVSRTNLLVRSEEFDNASWTKIQINAFGSGSTANAIAAPNGSVTADLITENTAAANHRVSQDTISGTTALGVYTTSVYFKSKERTRCYLNYTDNATGEVTATFNLSNQSSSVTAGGSWTGSLASIQAVGDGWYRCSLTSTKGNGSFALSLRVGIADNSSNISYTGDGTSGLYIWGAQLETGSTATAYIPTTNAAVTVFESSWYNQTEGTVFAQGQRYANDLYNRLFSLNSGSGSNILSVYTDSGPRYSGLKKVNNGADNYFLGPSVSTLATNLKTCLASNSTSSVIATSGTVGSEASIAGMPTVDRLAIGAEWYGAYYNGHLRRLTYWPSRLPNATLQQITR